MPAPYQPSNATEGDLFMQAHCNRCARWERGGKEFEQGCDIQLRSMAFSIGHPQYPVEWIRNDDNVPTCTAFQTPEEASQERYMKQQRRIESDGQGRLF
jgi:hypothetical protein